MSTFNFQMSMEETYEYVLSDNPPLNAKKHVKLTFLRTSVNRPSRGFEGSLSASIESNLPPYEPDYYDEEPPAKRVAPQPSYNEHEIRHQFRDDAPELGAQPAPMDAAYEEPSVASSLEETSSDSHHEASLADVNEHDALSTEEHPQEPQDFKVGAFKSSLNVVLSSVETLSQTDPSNELNTLYNHLKDLSADHASIWLDHVISGPKSLGYFVHDAPFHVAVALAKVQRLLKAQPSQASSAPSSDTSSEVTVQPPLTFFAIRKHQPANWAEVSKPPTQSKTKSKTKKSPSKAISVETTAEETPDKAIGPFLFELIFSPELRALPPPTVTLTCKPSGFVQEEAATGKKKPLPNVSHSALTHVSGDTYAINSVTFDSTSSGAPILIDFTFTFVREEGDSISAVATSLPIVVISNPSQWADAERAYVASLTFGLCHTREKPEAQIPAAAFLNGAHFGHMTCSRQLAAPHYINTLDSTVSGKGRKRAVRAARIAFNSGASIKRELSNAEIESIFPVRNGVITYTAFCSNWDWYGTLMYKLNVGGLVGNNIRTLWLSGLIHLAPPSGNDPCLERLPSEFSDGTLAYIRTSHIPGGFRIVRRKAATGDSSRDFAKRYAGTNPALCVSVMKLHHATHFVNLLGERIPKEDALRACKAEPIPKRPEDTTGIPEE